MPDKKQVPLRQVILVPDKGGKFVMFGLDDHGWLWVRSFVKGRWGDWHRDANPPRVRGR